VKPALAFVASTPTAATPLPAATRKPRRASFVEGQGFGGRRLFAATVVVVHVLGLWTLLQMRDARHRVAQVAPVVVRLIAPAEPPKPVPPPPLAAPQLMPPPLVQIEPPVIAIAAPPAPAPIVAVQPPPPPPAPAAVQTAPTPLVPVAPAPPAIRQIPASAVRYLKEPRMTVPLMSKRLRESGVVHLRVVVDVRGQPREIALAKSSGFARLDEQALQDMRSARFVPQTENGQPIEWEVIAPMSYEVER
jgi:protein TonB